MLTLAILSTVFLGIALGIIVYCILETYTNPWCDTDVWYWIIYGFLFLSLSFCIVAVWLLYNHPVIVNIQNTI